MTTQDLEAFANFVIGLNDQIRGLKQRIKNLEEAAADQNKTKQGS